MVHNGVKYLLCSREVAVRVLYGWLMFRHFITQWLEEMCRCFHFHCFKMDRMNGRYGYFNSSLYELGHIFNRKCFNAVWWSYELGKNGWWIWVWRLNNWPFWNNTEVELRLLCNYQTCCHHNKIASGYGYAGIWHCVFGDYGLEGIDVKTSIPSSS